MGWFSLIPVLIKLAALGYIVGYLGSFVAEYAYDKQQVASLNYQLAETKNQIKVLEANARLTEGTIATLNEVALTKNADLREMCAVLGDVSADKDPEADKPVGGVISKALERLKALRGNQ